MYFSIKSNFLSICVLSIKGAVLYKTLHQWWNVMNMSHRRNLSWIYSFTAKYLDTSVNINVLFHCVSYTWVQISHWVWDNQVITCCSALFLITGCFSKEKILTGTKSLNMIRGEITETNPPASLLKSVLQSCGALCWQQLSLTSCPVQNQIKPSQVSPTATPEPDFVEKVNKLTSEILNLQL